MPTTSLAAAAIDGRAQNARFIQHQLRALHDAVTQNAQALQDAAVTDGRANARDATMEISMALYAVKRHFVQCDVREALDDEYRVAAGRDWQSRRSAAGIVYIRPGFHTWLYSVVAAMSSAIAAGNCIMLEIQNSFLETPRVFRNSLLDHLDHDTFSVVENPPNDDNITSRCLVLDALDEEGLGRSTKVLRRPWGDSRVVAVVDRSADIAAAARVTVEARVAFNGFSPYAPDLVLVNEFVMEDFIRSAAQVFTQRLSGCHKTSQFESSNATPRAKERKDVLGKDERSDPDTIVIVEGDDSMLAKIGNRDLSVMSKKIVGPNLIIHAISSLDDAIDFANKLDKPLLAAYHFASLNAAKYTSQFIVASVAFVNHIPPEILVGPAAPIDWPVSAVERYRPEMFSTPSPIYVQNPDTNSVTNRSKHTLVNVISAASLPSKNQRDGKAVGFFDQGLITGMVLLLMPAVGGLLISSFYGGRAGWRWLRR